MTTTITNTTLEAWMSIGTHTHSFLAASFGAIVVILTIILLIQKEVTRSIGGTQAKVWVRTLNIAIIPLLFAFAVIIIMRFLDLNNYG
ncbi:MAG: hypothetical protein GFH27_549379n28 [Chloroflexi bacterium AL-W]|nr:hypothetical protein [Chloroflexi bacterium AL-N1]NOK71152.1 hypothetical protein [Chloroflexi bacterium AL-N10]NOK78618.1 hypothetical protein [Chloroflexi bacterium AL-N5]NOK85914.1 hypothetical protein [Chloroflexi bacterium AL-W]NOK92889.1 hypothetical protein [Chloroflexi bacterium AL-N15]